MKKISNIYIKSGFTKFKDNTNIEIPINKKENRIFIYGCNGTGKSSLAKLFYLANQSIDNIDITKDLSNLKRKGSSENFSVNICYNNELKTLFTEQEIIDPIKVPVFNQNYIDDKITYQEDFKNNKFKENKFNYGIELTSKTMYLNKLKDLNKAKNNLDLLKTKINENIELHINKLVKETATRKNNNIYQTLYTFENFNNLKPIKNHNPDHLIDKKHEHINYIKGLKDLDESNKIYFRISFLEDFDTFIKKIETINRSVKFNEEESKTKIAKDVLEKYDNDEKEWKLKGVNYLKNESCPFCETNISDNKIVQIYKDYLNSNINKMIQYINKEITSLKDILTSIEGIISEANPKALYLDKLFQTNLSKNIGKFENNLKIMVNQAINLLEEKSKKENLYIDCTDFITPVNIESIKDYKMQYQDLIEDIEKINKKVSDSSKDKQNRNNKFLEEVALFLVYEDIKTDLENISKIQSEVEDLKKESVKLKENYENEVKDKNELLKSLNNILTNFNINNYSIDENFDICLNGEKVSFSYNELLSNGEKTVIAFALFIAELRLHYNDDQKNIIFIDDPISSVDYPNLYVLYTYINEIINENINSQIFLTSHNLLFLNLFKYDYENNAIYFKLIEKEGKVSVIPDNAQEDSIYLEKLKVIYKVYKEKKVTLEQKLHIHNYCRYVLETISRFERPLNKKNAKGYINLIIEEIKTNRETYEISKTNFLALNKIINKGSHAGTNEVFDGEQFEDSDYINCCITIILFIKKKYRGQYHLVSNSYSEETSAINKDYNSVKEITY